jgi:copper chaperone
MMNLNVTDMTCGHCVKSITEAIHAVAPEALVLCDLEAKSVQVEGEYVAQDIQNAIAKAGFHIRTQ